MAELLDFLRACNWYPAIGLYFLAGFWIVEQDLVAKRIRANQAGAFCRHGNNPVRCIPCAAEFFNQGVAGDSFLAIPHRLADVDELEDELIEETPLERIQALPVPVTFRIPDQGSNHRPEIALELWTNAAWSSAPVKIGIQRGSGIINEMIVTVPSSVMGWRLQLPYHDLRIVMLPDTRGLDRIALLVNGCRLIDATPATLIAAEAYARTF